MAALAVVILSFGASSAGAATSYSTVCPAADDACKALAERIEANGDKLDQINDGLATLHADNGDMLAALSAPAPPPDPISGTVALASDDAQRLDLSAWGIWFMGGALLVLLFASKFHGSWRFWRE